nr:sterol uptake control protein 2 [Quercus suber]
MTCVVFCAATARNVRLKIISGLPDKRTSPSRYYLCWPRKRMASSLDGHQKIPSTQEGHCGAVFASTHDIPPSLKDMQDDSIVFGTPRLDVLQPSLGGSLARMSDQDMSTPPTGNNARRRKSHLKSRKGCDQCKKRHNKCNEVHPRCGHCTRLNAHCSFDIEVSCAIPSPLTPAGNARDLGPKEQSSRGASASEKPVDILDLELYNDFILHTLHEAPFDTRFNPQELGCFTQLTLATPYLLHSVLALSAIKIYLADGTRQELLLRASHLQSSAISLARPFYASPLSQEESISMLFFSAFAGHFSFAEGAVTATAERAASNGSFNLVKTLLSCFQLMRGIRTLLAPHWDYIKTSWIGPLFKASIEYGTEREESKHFLSAAAEPEISRYRALRSLAFGVDDAEQRRALLTLIERSFNYLHAVRTGDDDPRLNTTVVQSWCVDVDPVLDDLFLRNKPIALILVAYYAALMSHDQRGWWISNWPELLIQYVYEQLGEDWDEFLVGPKSLIRRAPDFNA